MQCIVSIFLLGFFFYHNWRPLSFSPAMHSSADPNEVQTTTASQRSTSPMPDVAAGVEWRSNVCASVSFSLSSSFLTPGTSRVGHGSAVPHRRSVLRRPGRRLRLDQGQNCWSPSDSHSITHSPYIQSIMLASCRSPSPACRSPTPSGQRDINASLSVCPTVLRQCMEMLIQVRVHSAAVPHRVCVDV